MKVGFEASIPSGIEAYRNGHPVRYGKDNLYPQFLYGLYFNSSIHKGIVNQKVTYTVTQGFDLKQDVKNVFTDVEDIDELFESISLDLEVLNYAVIKGVKSKGVWKFEQLDGELCRFSEDFSYCQYTEDWTRRRDIETLKLYTEIDEDDRECYVLIKFPTKQYKNEDEPQLLGITYPQPIYSGALADIMAHIEMSFYDFAETKNGFVSNTLIQLNNGLPIGADGLIDGEEADKIRRSYHRMFQDRKKKGGIIIHFNDSKENELSISELTKTNVGVYNETSERLERRIMMAHSVQNASLFGLETQGSLGGTSAEEQLVAFDKFVKTYILQRQKKIAKALNVAYRVLNNTELGFKFKVPRLNLPISRDNDGGGEFAKQTGLVSDEAFISEFKKRGAKREGAVLFEQVFDGQTDSEAIQSFFDSKSKLKFLTEKQEVLLTMIKQGATISEILKQFTVTELHNEIKRLAGLGLLEKSGGLKLTEKGNIEISQEEGDFEVVYAYDLIPGIPKAKSGSRPVCTSLMARSNSGERWTRKEIDEVGAYFNVDDIWRYRGGWYHNPVNGRTTKGCRHEWRQEVRLKTN